MSLAASDAAPAPEDGTGQRACIDTRQPSHLRRLTQPERPVGELGWGREDSNLRRRSQPVYSRSPLATRELPRNRSQDTGWPQTERASDRASCRDLRRRSNQSAGTRCSPRPPHSLDDLTPRARPSSAPYNGHGALLAQPVEHLHGKEGVGGSSPPEGFSAQARRTSRAAARLTHPSRRPGLQWPLDEGPAPSEDHPREPALCKRRGPSG